MTKNEPTLRDRLAVFLRAHEHARTSFAHNLSWHEETADALLAEFGTELTALSKPAQVQGDLQAVIDALVTRLRRLADDSGPSWMVPALDITEEINSVLKKSPHA